MARYPAANWYAESEYEEKGIFPFNHEIIDFKKTKALMYPFVGIWVNLEGRDPQGIVKPGKEYEQVRDEVIQLLKDVRDPEMGISVFADVFRIEDGGPYGLWGEADGDIRFFTNPGYTVYRSNFVTHELKIITSIGDGFTGDHGSCRPSARIGRGSEAAVFSCAGSGIKPTGMLKRPVFPTDIVPTICKLLGIDPPATSEGSILWNLLK